ncbi:class I SAM-dependent DNA methyltransferase [Glutamicibacter sp. NPDC087344]|uniref:class I SAM-dependent DNA methyltransferase n=1 Tax=Glutamicibacter sp. NPDC087344 TaxID=3363994 RepID=UPI003800A328
MTRRTDEIDARTTRPGTSDAATAGIHAVGRSKRATWPGRPGDFKAYVFPVMFFKWISDNWGFEHNLAVLDYGDNLTPEVEADRHAFIVPGGCHWADVFETTQHAGAKLDQVLQQLQLAYPESLANVFGDVNWANQDRLPQTALTALLNSFHGVRLDPDSVGSDMLGSAYEYLLREFAEASGKKAGEFFTPRHVVHLLVKLLDPKPGDSIADPACGSGGMLVETVTAIKKAGGNPLTLKLHGQEINLTTSAIAKMNLYLHGLEDYPPLAPRNPVRSLPVLPAVVRRRCEPKKSPVMPATAPRFTRSPG